MAKKAAKVLKRKLPPPLKVEAVPKAAKRKPLTPAQAEYKKVYPSTVYPEEK